MTQTSESAPAFIQSGPTIRRSSPVGGVEATALEALKPCWGLVSRHRRSNERCAGSFGSRFVAPTSRQRASARLAWCSGLCASCTGEPFNSDRCSDRAGGSNKPAKPEAHGSPSQTAPADTFGRWGVDYRKHATRRSRRRPYKPAAQSYVLAESCAKWFESTASDRPSPVARPACGVWFRDVARVN